MAGGLTGVAYRMKSVPADWINQLAREGDVEHLFREFANLCEKAEATKG